MSQPRSEDRSVALVWRLSPADRDHVHAAARAQGINAQTYLDRLVLGREDAQPRKSPHRGDTQAKRQP